MRNISATFLATAVLIAACAEPSRTPITTVRAVEATPLFASFKFTLDSVATTPDERVYGVPRSGGRRYITLRLTMASDTAVAAVQLGLPPASLKRIALLAKDELADFFHSSLGVDDTTVFAVFREEVRGTTIIADTAPRQDPSAASPQRRLTPTYLALLNVVPFADATHGPYRLRIDNIANAEGDSAAVISILSSSTSGVGPRPADWIPPHPVPLLGATIRAVNESAIVENFDVDPERRGDTITYTKRDEDGVVYKSLRVVVNAHGTVDRLAFTVSAAPGMLPAESTADELLKLAALLVPTSDSALVSKVARAPYATNPGADLATHAAIIAVLEGRRAEAMVNFPTSILRILPARAGGTVPLTGSPADGAPPEFVTVHVSVPDRARP